MRADRWERIKELVDSAVELSGEKRRDFLESACSGDADLRNEVNRLITEYESAGDFLSSPVFDWFAASHSLSPGELIASRYRVIQQIGCGGMGEVYEVKEEQTGDILALKTLRSEFASNQMVLQRFQKEIQLARKVTHTNVCPVFEVGIHEFTGSRPMLPFFTMKLLHGETLAARIKRSGRLTQAEAFPIIVQLAEGLQAAHESGVVHRDFKSANVMVCNVDGKDRAVITDFGLARFRPADSGPPGDATAQSNAGLAGTVGYMSPEQMTGGDITSASDIYSFGVVLFEMAAGKLPFDDRHLINSAVQRASGKIPWIRAAVPDIDPQWEAAIARCLEPDPRRRFRSAGEIADHFRENVWRVPRPRLTRRQYLAVGAAAALTLSLFGGYLYRATRPYEPKPEAQVWYETGVEHVRATMFEAARRALEKSVAIDGNYATAHAYLAMAYSELDYSERAKESALRAATAVQEYRVSAEDALRIRGLQHYAAHDFELAEPIFAELASGSTGRSNASALLELAWVAKRAEDTSRAENASAKAVEADSNYAAAWLLRAELLAQARRNPEAFDAFSRAESLFNAASNYEGVTETLMQRGIHLARVGQPEAAISTMERAMPIAKGTGDDVHLIRLDLAQALAYRGLGQIARSQEAAAQATELAVQAGQDAWAAVGLLDLGSAYFAKGEPVEAERYFRQGLEFARRQKWRFHEARARLLLASLYMQYSRTPEALEHVQAALPFLRQGKYRRELLQGLMILGGVQGQGGDFAESEKSLREAMEGFDRTGQDLQGANARSVLAEVLTKAGSWSEALELQQRAIEQRRAAQPKETPLHSLVARARIYARLGRAAAAEQDLREVESHLGELAGTQAQLRGVLACAEAEASYIQCRWREAGNFARRARATNGAQEDMLFAEVMEGLCEARLGKPDHGLAQVESAIRTAESRGLAYAVHSAQAALAQTLWEMGRREAARGAAENALPYLDQRQMWDSSWRCRYVSGDTATAGAQRDRLAGLLKGGDYQNYLQRPDVQKLVF